MPSEIVKRYSYAHLPALELHPRKRGLRFVLVGIYPEDHETEEVVEGLEEKGLEVASFGFRAPDDESMTAIGVHKDPDVPDRTGIPHKHSSDWDYVRIVAHVFRRRLRKDPGRVRFYKPLDVEEIHKLAHGLQFDGTILNVASGLLSRPILKHALPNANHRTHLDVTRLYLKFQDIAWPHYDIRGGGSKRFWRDINRDFIPQSKYILQLRRRSKLVETAWQHGFKGLRLAHSTYCDIDPDDFALDEKDLRDKHREHCEQFILNLLDQEGEAKIREPARRGRGAFTDWALERR